MPHAKPTDAVIVRLDREHRQKFGAGHIIDIPLQESAKVIQSDHDSLKPFGVGAELRETEWRGVVRQLLVQSLIAVKSNACAPGAPPPPRSRASPPT